MFNSTQTIFDQYIDGASRFNIYSVEMERGENPEDLYFLCHIDGTQYIVFETDYINSLSHIAKEAANTFAHQSIQPIHWLVKKNHQDTLNTTIIPLETSDAKSSYDAVVLKQDDSYLRYAILAVKINGDEKFQYHPNTYGQMKAVGSA